MRLLSCNSTVSESNSHYASDDGLNGETFTATTGIFQVRVVEFKAFIQPFFNKIQLSAFQIGETFRINNYFDTFIIKYLIFTVHFINEFENLGHTGTAGSFNAKA